MLPEILTRINWIDIFVVIILFRIGYISLRSGLPVEIFKFLGVISAVYLAMHYHLALSGALKGYLGFLQNAAPEILDFFTFLFLVIAGYLICVFLRIIFYRFIKVDATARLDRWGGFVLGALRGFLLASLILFTFVLSPLTYLKESVDKSYSGNYLLGISPNIYSSLWNSVFSKFRSGEKFNGNTLEVIQNRHKREKE